MNWYLGCILLYAAWITPLWVGARLSFGTGEYPNGVLGARIWGVGANLFWETGRQEDGTLTLSIKGRPDGEGAPPDLARAYRGAQTVLMAYRSANIGKALLKKAVGVEALQIDCTVGLSDASATALLTGALLALSKALSRAGHPFAAVRADFRGASRVRARCIISARLGMLICVGICFVIAYMRAKARAKGWGRWKNRTSEA